MTNPNVILKHPFAAAALAILLAASADAMSSQPCPAVSANDEVRLVSYVTKKYNIPATVKITIKSASSISDDCHRKLVFAGQGPLGEFELALFSSPDLRFLSQELMDSSLDPAKERYEKARQVMSQLDNGDRPSLGDAHAPVTLVVFSDFECPFCKQAAATMRAEPLIDGKQVRVVYRHFPLSQHPWAQKAAEAAACAGFQSTDLFWKMHDAIFRNQTEITPSVADDKIKALAGEIEGLNKTTLADCMQRQLSLGAVLRDQQLGKQLGVNGTPTIFINGEVQHIGSPDTFHQMLLDYLQGTSSDESGLYIPAKASPSQPDKGSSFAGATALEKSTKP